MPNLIVSADDIGLSKRNTDTILESVDQGSVTSVSVLANGFAFDYAMKEIRRRPQLRVAVHVNLSEGKPLSRVEHLIDGNGNFYSTMSLWITYLRKNRSMKMQIRKEVRQEIEAQIALVASHHTGTIHIDGHQHVHLLPFVFDELLGLMKEKGIESVRLLREPFFLVRTSLTSYSPRHLIGHVLAIILTKGARRKAARAGVPSNDYFVGVIFSGHMYETPARAGLSAVLSQRHQGSTEILFHPGSAFKEELLEWSGNRVWHYDPARSIERAFVTSLAARELFNAFETSTLPAGVNLERFFRYAISGTLAAITHLGFLYIFTEYGHLWYVVSNIFAFGLGLIVSFTLQKFWTFEDATTDRMHRQALAYALMQMVSLGVNTVLLYISVTYLHLWYLIAEIMILILVAIGNFFISKNVIFKHHG